jgi:hypothetical protein
MAADDRQVSGAWRWPHLLVWFPMASTESLRSCASLTAWYNENAGGRVIDDHPDPVDVLSRHPVCERTIMTGQWDFSATSVAVQPSNAR